MSRVMHSALTGVQVLVTRPQPQADALAASLRNAGATPFVFPVIDIVPRALTAGDEAIIAELDRYQAVICISAPAAELGVRLCADRWPQWPLHQRWYAVGPASGKPLQGWGLALHVAQAGSTSETLLALPELQNVTEQRFLILRGEGGRETLADTLRSRGAQVDYLELYERRSAVNDPACLAAFLLAPPPRVAITTSGESLDHLLLQAKAQAPSQADALRVCPLIVVSGRLAQHACQQGFSDVHIAAGASDEALLECLQTLPLKSTAASTPTSTSLPTRPT